MISLFEKMLAKGPHEVNKFIRDKENINEITKGLSDDSTLLVKNTINQILLDDISYDYADSNIVLGIELSKRIPVESKKRQLNLKIVPSPVYKSESGINFLVGDGHTVDSTVSIGELVMDWNNKVNELVNRVLDFLDTESDSSEILLYTVTTPGNFRQVATSTGHIVNMSVRFLFIRDYVDYKSEEVK